MGMYSTHRNVASRLAASSGQFIQSGYLLGTTDGSAQITLTFPTAFASDPIVVGQALTGTDRFVVLNGRTTTQATWTYYDLSTGTSEPSTGVGIQWIAIGTL